MILPEHCRFVSLKKVKINLRDREEIKRSLKNKEAYFSSKYIVLLNEKSNDAAIVETELAGKGFIQKIINLSIISMPEETSVIKRPIDVRCKSELITTAYKEAKKSNAKAVVVFGEHEHMNFVIDPLDSNIKKIQVIDVVPPFPSKLMEDITYLRRCGLIKEKDFFIDFELNAINLIEKGRKYIAKNTLLLFPCDIGITKNELNGNFAFLTDVQEVKENNVLIGCEVSKMVFEEKFNEKFIHENICPREVAKEIVRHPFILRCCLRDKLGFMKLNNNIGIAIHFGASKEEIASSLNELIGRI
ncbi:MAG: hypothetical protein ACE5K4_02230 [Candidatus Hydrothermarchaeota archaeon]